MAGRGRKKGRAAQEGGRCAMGACEKALRTGECTVERRLEAFLAAPDDVEALHKLRVSIRALRSLVAFMAPWLKRKTTRRVQRDLKGIVAKTSYLRELDVLMHEVAGLGGSVDELLASLAVRRREERDRLVAVLADPATRRTLKRVRKRMGHLPWRRAVRDEGLAAAALEARACALARAVDEGMATVDVADAEAVHDLRKDAKRVRYVAEALGDVVGADAAHAAGTMKAVQDLLGALCDARVNQAIACELPRDGLSDVACAALDELARTSATREVEFMDQIATFREAS